MAKDTSTPTQEHLPIAGIQDGVVIMNDGSIRAVLKVEPINFELKSENEQNAAIYGYQSFLNSLEFPIQIVIQSKKLDLERYLQQLTDSQKNIPSDLLRIQIEDYVGFVRRLITIANIMSKKFYVIVSYSAMTKQNALAGFTAVFNKQASGPLLDQETFERFQKETINRSTIIANGLTRIGLKVDHLNTQQLIELYYTAYNPDIATEERLTSIEDMSGGVVASPDIMQAMREQVEAEQPELAEPVVDPVEPEATFVFPPAQDTQTPPLQDPQVLENPPTNNQPAQ